MEYARLFNMYLRKANETKNPESRAIFTKLAQKTALDARVKALETNDVSLLNMSNDMFECL